MAWGVAVLVGVRILLGLLLTPTMPGSQPPDEAGREFAEFATAARVGPVVEPFTGSLNVPNAFVAFLVAGRCDGSKHGSFGAFWRKMAKKEPRRCQAVSMPGTFTRPVPCNEGGTGDIGDGVDQVLCGHAGALAFR